VSHESDITFKVIIGLMLACAYGDKDLFHIRADVSLL